MPRKADKPRLPANLRPLADAAIERHIDRPIPPSIVVKGCELSGLTFSSPYAPADDDAWQALLFQAFGTRSIPVVRAFLTHLAKVGPKEWDGKASRWSPSQDSFEQALAILNAINPKNEAQAAYAAQLCSLNICAMRMGERMGEYPDARSMRAFTKAVRAFGDGLETIERLKGKRRRSKQTIEVHHHEHKHIHYSGGGSENGGQPHATAAGATLIESRATLPGKEPLGEIVPIAGRKG